MFLQKFFQQLGRLFQHYLCEYRARILRRHPSTLAEAGALIEFLFNQNVIAL